MGVKGVSMRTVIGYIVGTVEDGVLVLFGDKAKWFTKEEVIRLYDKIKAVNRLSMREITKSIAGNYVDMERKERESYKFKDSPIQERLKWAEKNIDNEIAILRMRRIITYDTCPLKSSLGVSL